jgi:23S rRNA (cytidine1920-2'-O)/16S rRNA (cytidine1409-2'-O)-methyltransferase
LTADTGNPQFVSRGGRKLAAALDCFRIDVHGLICADLGSHVGGFVDCLLQRGAARVHSVDTAYGTLAWKLRKDPRVVVYERTNALHALFSEPVDLVTIDVGWTPQAKILPSAARAVRPGGAMVSLIKPHYEADRAELIDGVLPDEATASVLERTLCAIRGLGFSVENTTASPLRGHGGNREYFAHLRRCE